MTPLDALGCLVSFIFPDLILLLLAALPIGIYPLCIGETVWGALVTSIGAVYIAYLICRGGRMS